MSERERVRESVRVEERGQKKNVIVNAVGVVRGVEKTASSLVSC